MIPSLRTPAQSLDLAYRRQKPTREQLDQFEAGRATLLRDLHHAVAENETEEYAKNLVVRFLANTNFGSYDVNVRHKRDLVIRTGARPQDPVGVILEFKRPQSAAEMVTPTNLNRRAFHELLYYYLQDRDKRADADSKSLKRLVITNGFEWFIFDALDFDRLFWSNTDLKRQFREFERKAASSKKTSFFYNDIAAPFLEALAVELPFTHFDLATPTAERDLLLLAKLLSPPHLLKEPFAQDANTLNRAFYEELLYLIGLEEVKDKGRKLIQRCAPERRQPGSLLENTLLILDSENELTNLSPAEAAPYGTTTDERLVGVALELCLTWVNRLLFLKLLEGQLRRYHAGHDALFRFLTPELIPEYDTLNKLFFRVLNTPADERREPVKTQYAHIPYLNSSLYEPSFLENKTIKVSSLEDHLDLPLHRKSVLRTAGPPPQALAYLLRFLDAYDFASEGEEQVQEEGKALISAAVLGLIFEKLNGYKDGSFYTPGFITMYICRQTLRRAVVQHFNKAYGFGAESIEQLADALDGKLRPEYSQYFNQLTVCDPAVGSGHFLVSALNELLAVKSELSLLLDDEGRRLRYSLVVARDELVVKDEDERLVQYRATLAPDGTRSVPLEHTRLQSALFREKRYLMEHALFGVDLNPNSVRICRLRLWIELLKHAYYRPDSQFRELETLPNLDLNIKPGNSLLSRFPLDADLSDVFKQGKFSLQAYRATVHTYFNSRGREAKENLQGYLQQIKQQFTAVLHKKDKKREALRLARNQRIVLDTQVSLIPETKKETEARKFEMRRLELLAQQLDQEITAYEQGALFRDAFEWRFEFPEVLDDQGAFRGFDVVVGNPPYIRHEELAPVFKQHLKAHYATAAGTADLYVYFYELGLNLLAPGGELSFITNNKWLRAGYGQALRRYLLAPELQLLELLDFGDLPVFPEATTYPNILSVRRGLAGPTVRVAELTTLGADPTRFPEVVEAAAANMPTGRLSAKAWSLAAVENQELLEKLRNAGTPLGEYVEGKIYNGVKTGFNEAFVIDTETRSALLATDPTSVEFIKPFLVGKDIKRYMKPNSVTHLLYIDWKFNIEKYPAIKAHLVGFQKQLSARSEVKKGNYPWYALERARPEIKAEFGKPKICWPGISSVFAPFAYDSSGQFGNDNIQMIIADDLYILGVLNAATSAFYISEVCDVVQGGFVRMKMAYVAQLPIPAATPEQQAEIAALVEQVLAAKAADATADTSAPEQQIDELVAALYGLTAAEKLLLAS
ncbi:type IIG restriction enzyme/methyltransferase [Hymenobacter lapidiphilus]|uniref:site-specific DNA-methyltransferase (adenine-specific) n=1 Tax=Hymenobacter lapidiphilus TaxID=2608003 RepID=A0A7Y7U5A3_9BACT|nr:TaqI-like C-terminal specificity domain-containing protein [Hymenobacter lapidiphilus]NVO30255.1 Eco57I restriction-modification methylase domain-containing protein [Hymenobacter lapidiphilus]